MFARLPGQSPADKRGGLARVCIEAAWCANRALSARKDNCNNLPRSTCSAAEMAPLVSEAILSNTSLSGPQLV